MPGRIGNRSGYVSLVTRGELNCRYVLAGVSAGTDRNGRFCARLAPRLSASSPVSLVGSIKYVSIKLKRRVGTFRGRYCGGRDRRDNQIRQIFRIQFGPELLCYTNESVNHDFIASVTFIQAASLISRPNVLRGQKK